MSWRVVWSPKSRELMKSHLWLAHEKGRNSRPLKQAARDLNELLGRDPHTAGESRDGNERLVFVRPMSALYETFPAHNIVFIYRIKVRWDESAAG